MDLVFLPCGCTVAADTHILHLVEEHMIECPWCHATFDTDDVQRWAYYCLTESVTPMAHFSEQPPVYLHHHDLVEVTGRRCQCGAMLLRECATREIRHPLPADTIQRLWS